MPGRRRSLDGLNESLMSPATARIHRRNINNLPQVGATLPGAESSRDPLKQHTVISTPTFSALPLFLPLTDEQQSEYSTTPAPPTKRHKGQPTVASAASALLPSPPPPPPPPSSLVSSRGRHIKLREGSIHLQRRDHSAKPTSKRTATHSSASTLSPSLSLPSQPPPHLSDPSSSPSPATASPLTAADSSPTVASAVAENACLSAFSPPVYRSWVHSWCLWQMRCEYLLGEVRRRLSKREAGRALQSPHGGRKRGQDTQSQRSTQAPSGRSERDHGRESGREEAETKNKEESLEQEQREERKEAALTPSLASADFLSQLVSRIPPVHTQLTLPLINSLTLISSVPVPPSAIHVPLLSALASCLLLPLPRPLSAVPPTAPQRPFIANYQHREGQLWRLPEQRIAVQWADVLEQDEDEGPRTSNSSGSSNVSDRNGRQVPLGAHKPHKAQEERKQQPIIVVTKKRVERMTQSRGVRTVQRIVRQQVSRTAVVRSEGQWMDEPSEGELREANRLSRQQRMAERERREKVRDARRLALPHSKRRRMEPVAHTSLNETAAQAAHDLLPSHTDMPS